MFSLKEVKYKDILSIAKLEMHSNKVTTIVGESGSGKTTLLKLLNKLIHYDSGEIYFKSVSLKNIDSIELRRKVVMLSQSPTIFTGSIKDNLLIGLKFSEKPLVSDEKLSEGLKLVQLYKDLSDNAEKLSEGEKQRVCLSRIILMQPEVLLLDEPSSALDAETEDLIISSMVNYTKSNNRTLIMVTHSKKVATDFSDEIIEINKGRIIRQWEAQSSGRFN